MQIANSEKGQAVKRLYAISTNLPDTILAVQRDTLAALSDLQAFEKAKSRAIVEVTQMAAELQKDAMAIGIESRLDALILATSNALRDLPFPQELAVGADEGGRQALDLGMRALDTFLAGRNPMHEVRRTAEREVGGRMTGLKQRYAEWWNKHSPVLHRATSDLQDGLFSVLSQLPYQKGG